MCLCEAECNRAGIAFHYDIHQLDFITCAAELLIASLFRATDVPYFNIAILNPPYRKIHSESDVAKTLKRANIKANNLYAAFLALTVRLLAPKASLVALTPRSFCNGPYFRPFRELLIQELAFRRFHLFQSREELFRDDTVVQENLILYAQKEVPQPEKVTISTTMRLAYGLDRTYEVPFDQIVHSGDSESFIHIISDEQELEFKKRMTRLPSTLSDLGISVSTGKVVDFRAQGSLSSIPGEELVPLIHPLNLLRGTVAWPKLDSKKPNYIAITDESRNDLLPNENYVLVKRFSSKEEKKRIAAAVYEASQFSGEWVAFENRLNYFHRSNRGLERSFARGLAAFLNSAFVDAYFRLFNGHTQVNATDLRSLRYPTYQQLEAIGKMISEADNTQEKIDSLIERELLTIEEQNLEPIHYRSSSE